MSLERDPEGQMTDAERKAKILAMQCPSTRRALERPESEDEIWHDRTITGWLAVPDAKTMEERVAARKISFQEAQVQARMRYERGKRLSEMRQEGEFAPVKEEKRNAAIAAFMFVNVKFKDLMRQAGLGETPKEEKVGLWQRFWGKDNHED